MRKPLRTYLIKKQIKAANIGQAIRKQNEADILEITELPQQHQTIDTYAIGFQMDNQPEEDYED